MPNNVEPAWAAALREIRKKVNKPNAHRRPHATNAPQELDDLRQGRSTWGTGAPDMVLEHKMQHNTNAPSSLHGEQRAHARAARVVAIFARPIAPVYVKPHGSGQREVGPCCDRAAPPVR